ncbi:uncharacterized protein LOC6040803 [Culex quinquefasciatus]|uniref:uncharacterized protein LOC6040803 n=1 Tax=Culex quinquefasciatus TaxID=7176 RepID=UPI0018E29788|nr:uncharacterized protein LOC6040803 [Culex quinquefasciatus]
MRISPFPGGIWISCVILGILAAEPVFGQLPRNPCLPRCVTWQEIYTLWPTANEQEYWQCVAMESDEWWTLQRITCPEGSVFDYGWQLCVDRNYVQGTVSVQCGVKTPEVPPMEGSLGVCPEPGCVTFEQINTLWAIPDPEFFLQCRPEPDATWVLKQMPCAPGTLFHFGLQTCVTPDEWLACDGQVPNEPTDVPPVPSPAPTPVTTVAPTPPPVTTVTPTLPPVTTVTPTLPPVTTVTPTLPPVTTVTPTLPPVTTVTPTLPPVTTVTPTLPPVTTAPPPVTTADPDQDVGDFCIEPLCDTWQNINTLWPLRDPNFFYQCRPAFGGGWIPQQMPCAPGTVFSFRHQVCVWPIQWVDPCGPADPTTDDDVTDAPTTVTTGKPTPTGTPYPSPIPTTTPETTTPTAVPPPPGVDCLRPNCVFLQNTDILWPTRTPQDFYRCIFLLDTFWFPFLDTCPFGKYFSFEYQSCVDPLDWNDVCAAVPEDITTTQMTTTEAVDEGIDPLPVICGSPRCDTVRERELLWPSTVANQFYECVWVERFFQFIPFPKRCPNFYLFDFMKQDCVHPLEWTDICPIYPTLPPSCPDCCPTCPPGETTTTVAPSDPINVQLPIVCGVPRCRDEDEIAFLWPDLDPRAYHRCMPTTNEWHQAVISWCEVGEMFQTLEQRCVPEEEYEDIICPIYSEPITAGTAGTPTEAPVTTPEEPEIEPELTCVDDFDPTSLYPITCDVPRCVTQGDQNIRWPATDSETYFVCQALGVGSIQFPSRMRCAAGTRFDFFRQCCTVEIATVEVCPVFPIANPVLTCSSEFNVSSILPAACDVPRCNGPSEIVTFWPSQLPNKYYECSENTFGNLFPLMQDCPTGTSFDFFQQCCTIEPALTAAEVCTLFNEPPAVPSIIPEPAPMPLLICDRPRCETPEERAQMWPSRDPTLYYTCGTDWDGTWRPYQYSCSSGTLFLADRQLCGEPWLWQETCGEEEPATSTTEDVTDASTQPSPNLTPPNLLRK